MNSFSVQRRNQMKILLIAAISILPFIAAWLYTLHPEWLGSRGNYGRLVTPALPMNYSEMLEQPVANRTAGEALPGRWVMVMVTGDQCGDDCLELVSKTYQLRLMLNKETLRVRRLLLMDGTGFSAGLQQWLSHDDQLAIALLKPGVRRLLEQANGGDLQPGQILLLDPEANLMMVYQAGFDPYGVLRDLKHLLRASQIG
ncbi:MAG: hypothetical protein RIQ52_29 [Pseudomonadota bacterium]|jgi:hypothetical protein